MEIRLFNKEKDYEKIAQWWIEHDQVPSSVDLLPNIGYIIDDLAAGFLYQTDSGICFIEELISNKKSDKGKRRNAVDLVVESLIDSAKKMGYKKIIFSTINPRIKQASMTKWQAKEFQGSQERLYRSL